MTEKHFQAGEIIFNEGDVAEFAYTVASGSVALSYRSHDGEIKLATIEAGGIIGEVALFHPEELRNNTATAASETVLHAVSIETFDAAFASCPDVIKPFIKTAFDKFIPAKTRTQLPVNAMTVADILRITISTPHEPLKPFIGNVVLTLDKLPFRIGGYPEDGEKNRKDNVHLAIPSVKNPLVISRQHLEITVENETIVVNDLGSRFGTSVNNRLLGRGRGMYYTPLQKGENTVILGLPEKHYILSILCE